MHTSRLPSATIGSRTRSYRTRCRASSDRSSRTVTLPIFPLRLVALPSATVPLMIFEPKYRVLFNTLLHGMEGVEEGLVQTDSPFCGTKKFGMVFSDKTGNLASVGTVLEIQDFAHVQKDGRLFVTSKGRERFSITGVVKDKRLPSVLVCEVELRKEDDSQESKPEVKELAKEVADLLRSTIKLNVKMNNISASEDQLEPEELAELGPRDISFFVASFFADAQPLQQILLEEDNTMARLQREKDVLTETVQFYSAALAVKVALSPSSSDVQSSDK